jgi:hypothetical protein
MLSVRNELRKWLLDHIVVLEMKKTQKQEAAAGPPRSIAPECSATVQQLFAVASHHLGRIHSRKGSRAFLGPDYSVTRTTSYQLSQARCTALHALVQLIFGLQGVRISSTDMRGTGR